MYVHCVIVQDCQYAKVEKKTHFILYLQISIQCMHIMYEE